MKFLRILAVIIIPAFSMFSSPVAANGAKAWHEVTEWRLKLALRRMPLHLLPRSTMLNAKFIITSRGEMRNVSAHSNPSMPALDSWVKKSSKALRP